MATKKKDNSVNIELENILEIDLDSNSLIPESFNVKFFKLLAQVEGVDEYLRLTLVQDVKKYFMAATDKERDQVRGHIGLANYLKKRILFARQ